MRKDVVALEERERVGRVLQVLRETVHHGFPLVDRIDESLDSTLPDYGRLKVRTLRFLHCFEDCVYESSKALIEITFIFEVRAVCYRCMTWFDMYTAEFDEKVLKYFEEKTNRSSFFWRVCKRERDRERERERMKKQSKIVEKSEKCD